MVDTKILHFIRKQGGYVQTHELIRHGVHTRDIKRLLNMKKIERVKAGLYRLTNLEYTPEHEYVELCLAIPKAVICLYTALSQYELTTYAPTAIMISLPKGYHAPKIEHPPFVTYRFSVKQYQAGIQKIRSGAGLYRIYDAEKSICDVFRFRRKLGDDTAKEALFEYLNRKSKDLEKLVRYSKLCRVYNIMKPYMEARLG